MRVVHLCTTDSVGGAARSAFNLHVALLTRDIDSVFFAAEKSQKGDPTIVSFRHGYFKRRALDVIDAILTRWYRNRSGNYPFTNNWFPMTGTLRKIRKLKPDIVHIHWIGKGMIGLEDLQKIKVPIVWTLHDSYAYTGGCHLPQGCLKFNEGCHKCPQLQSTTNNDLSAFNFRRKKKIYQKLDITFVAPSHWMANSGRGSALLNTLSVEHVPNLINTTEYYPLDKRFARNSLGLSAQAKVIVFGAVNSTSDVNKGFKELTEALSLLPGDELVEICIFGANKPSHAPAFKFKTHYLGYLNDTISKRILYSAAEVIIVPSKVENLSNVIMEAMACGTPVVAFDTGGNSDLIDHKVNGFLAAKNDVNSLCEGIQWVLQQAAASELSLKARAKIATTFGLDAIVQKHKTLYHTIKRG